jgi:hypothetical protein
VRKNTLKPQKTLSFLSQLGKSGVAVHSAQREAGAKLDAFWGIDVLRLGGL